MNVININKINGKFKIYGFFFPYVPESTWAFGVFMRLICDISQLMYLFISILSSQNNILAITVFLIFMRKKKP